VFDELVVAKCSIINVKKLKSDKLEEAWSQMFVDPLKV
jgi:hypothetical protein